MDSEFRVIGGALLGLVVLLIGAAFLADERKHDRELQKMQLLMECIQTDGSK